MGTRFSLFSIAVGDCGIVWNENGIAAVQLPEIQGAARTRARLARKYPQALESSPSASGGVAMKQLLLKIEGVDLDPQLGLFADGDEPARS